MKLLDQIKASRHVESDDRLIVADEKLASLKARVAERSEDKNKIGDRREALKAKSATDILAGGAGDFTALRKLDDEERAMADEIDRLKSVINQAEQAKIDLKARLTTEYARAQWKLAEATTQEIVAALDVVMQKKNLLEAAVELPHVDTRFRMRVQETLRSLQNLSDEVGGDIGYSRDWIKELA